MASEVSLGKKDPILLFSLCQKKKTFDTTNKISFQMTHNIRSTVTDVNYLQAPVENGNGHSVTPHTEEAEEDTEAALPSSQQPKRSLEETAEPEAAAPESKRPCVESETNQPPPAPAAPNGVNSTPPQPIATGGD